MAALLQSRNSKRNMGMMRRADVDNIRTSRLDQGVEILVTLRQMFYRHMRHAGAKPFGSPPVGISKTDQSYLRQTGQGIDMHRRNIAAASQSGSEADRCLFQVQVFHVRHQLLSMLNV